MASDIPQWPDPATDAGKTFFLRAQEILAAWEPMSLSNPAKFALLAMAEAESSLDPNAQGDYGGAAGEATAFGLYQWHAARLAAIKTALGTDISADVRAGKGQIATQVQAAWWELKNLPWAGLKAMEAQSTAYGAALKATALFERAGALDAAQRRGRMARRRANRAAGIWPASGGPKPADWARA
jgi:Phage tail lysozyme